MVERRGSRSRRDTCFMRTSGEDVGSKKLKQREGITGAGTATRWFCGSGEIPFGARAPLDKNIPDFP
jgi:hypothetical protein